MALMPTARTKEPRERAGSYTQAAYGYQIRVAMLKILEMHEAGRDYRAAFDHHDDLLVFDTAHDPKKVELYQVKTKTSGVYKMATLRAANGKGPKPRSYIGKMHDHMNVFGQDVARLGFVSNLGYALKLKSGKLSGKENVTIRAAELHDDEIDAIRQTAANDCETPCSHDGSDRYLFETSPMGLVKQDVFVRGVIGDYLAKRSSGSLAPKAHGFYDTLYLNVQHRAEHSQIYASDEEFYRLKTLCREDIEDLVINVLASKRFHDNWSDIADDLRASGVPSLEVIVIHTDCIAYTSARGAGETGATAFSNAAESARVGRKAEIKACPHLRHIAELLDRLVPLAYENRRGALYVEAFEALQWTAKT